MSTHPSRTAACATLSDKRPVAFITGASRGIGRGIAIELARHGYDIAGSSRVLDSQNTESGCPGFYAGMMWLAFEETGEAKWRQVAEQYTRALEPRKFDRDVRDLGFIFMSTVDRWYRLLGDDDPAKQWLKDILVTAGTVQSFRWKDTGEDHYIYSFHGPQSLFIDIMMNIRLLFRAHQLGGDEELFRKAGTHARTTEKYLVRKRGARIMDREGSVIHEGIFNPARGEY